MGTWWNVQKEQIVTEVTVVAEIVPCSILPREMRLNQSEFLYQGRICEVAEPTGISDYKTL